MKRFDISGMLIELTSDNPYICNQYNDFITTCRDKADLIVDISSSDYICKPDSKILFYEEVQKVYFSANENYFYIFACKQSSDEIAYMVEINNNWDYACAVYLKSDHNSEYDVLSLVGAALFRNCILFHQGIVIHSSAIDWEGKGILFTAPAGTGKSTQANLWRAYKGAKVLNGDRPAVRVIDNHAYVFGTPWSGSSPDFLNSSAPISAIVVLEQSPANNIFKLTGSEAASKIVPRCFLPYYDSTLMDMAINNIEKVIDKVPVYLLKCRPDKEAVELVYQCVR